MRFLIADDHDLIVDGLKNAIAGKYSDAEIDTASLKSELDYFLNLNSYDLLILDIKFGQSNAKGFIKELMQKYHQLKVLILSSLDDQYTIQFFVNAGVQGYIIKSDSIVDILNGVDKVIKGEVYFSAEVQEKLEGDSNDIILTPREKEVLAVILEEKSIKQIAEQLHISEKTVEMHRSNLFLKLDVKNVTGLVKKSILLNLLDQ
ncbi:response regulator transcription factor [Paracrocinitomix mangrovi]|uniref:LuxR C-terminal-related transcriptional regulator n=1 Tax=Paracrocinitomix mangrovi TaxID=2862509 RepID=UPI001C8CF8A7|nr:response regulator transcription factor [Paracrocinitomix mangrovi]UKN00289.1 response regulator transcription factor [Paracrocinitomix mangrovi]